MAVRLMKLSKPFKVDKTENCSIKQGVWGKREVLFQQVSCSKSGTEALVAALA
jgi:hypothetical protein